MKFRLAGKNRELSRPKYLEIQLFNSLRKCDSSLLLIFLQEKSNALLTIYIGRVCHCGLVVMYLVRKTKSTRQDNHGGFF